MAEKKTVKFLDALEHVAGKWWCGLIIVVLFFIPAYTQIPFNSQDTPKVIAEVLQKPFIYQIPVIFAVIKVIFMLLLVSILLKNTGSVKVFKIYIALLFLAVSIFQNMSFTQSFGFSFLTGNFILVLIVAIIWAVQLFSSERNSVRDKIGVHKYWLILLALLAFWFPVDNTGMHPQFSLTELIANESMVTFCMITPVVLVSALLLDRVNLITLKITAFIGTIFGIMNAITWFVLNSEMWWMGILHLPLLIISAFTYLVVRKEIKLRDLSENNEISVQA